MDKAKTTAEADLGRINEIVAEYSQQKWALIPLLQEVQEEFGYIPPEAIRLIARGLGLFPAQVQGVISFYAQFYTARQGRNIVKVCRGTACYTRGGVRILSEMEKQLGIKPGETTCDFKYTLEAIACFGSCALAPVVVIGKNVYGRMTPTKVGQILADTK